MSLISGIKHFFFDRKTKNTHGISADMIQRIRDGGGKVGEGVTLWKAKIDMENPYLISIGDHVTLTEARILTHDASMNIEFDLTRCQSVKIGSYVFVGKDAIIMPGVTIGDRVIVGAGSVVTKDIPENSVAAGNPCRVICSYDEYIEKVKAQMKEWVIIDKTPDEIMKDKESIDRLVSEGKGFIR